MEEETQPGEQRQTCVSLKMKTCALVVARSTRAKTTSAKMVERQSINRGTGSGLLRTRALMSIHHFSQRWTGLQAKSRFDRLLGAGSLSAVVLLFLCRGEYSWVHSLTGLPKQAGINQNKYPHATLGMADAGGCQA